MTDQGWLKLLDLVRRELSAVDAFVQIGGEEPTDPKQICVPLEGARRLVVVLQEAPEHATAARDKLTALRDAFVISTGQRTTLGEPPDSAASPPTRRSELDQALADTARRARANSALVFDIDSPVVWGCSIDSTDLDVTLLQETAEVDAAVGHAGLTWDALLRDRVESTLEALEDGLPEGRAGHAVESLHRLWHARGREAVHRRLRIARTLRSLRLRHPEDALPGELTLREPGLNCVLREFATLYRLLLVFEDAFSPLHAEAAVQRSLGHIERLVLALPPIDPGGGGRSARVLRLV